MRTPAPFVGLRRISGWTVILSPMNWTIPARRETIMSTMFAEPVAMTTEIATPTDATLAPDVAGAELNEFNYRPVPALVPVSGAFVLLSVAAFIWDVLVLVPVVSLGLSVMALRQIRRSPREWSGLTAATMFAVLSGAAAVGSVALHAYNYATELPAGFERVSFARDISERGLCRAGWPGLGPTGSAATLGKTGLRERLHVS
jgi:hypothetical protein